MSLKYSANKPPFSENQGTNCGTWVIYLFYTPNLKAHILVTCLYGSFMGFMVFLLAAVDNPLRGEVSISSEPYQAVLDGLSLLDPSNQ